MPATIHDLPPELIQQILTNLSPNSPATTQSTDHGAPLPSAFDQYTIYAPFASTSRQLYEITAPFLHSSLTINAIVNNIGMDRHQCTPVAFHGIRDPDLQRKIRALKELIVSMDSVGSTGSITSNHIKSVTLVFANQQTTRPGLFRGPQNDTYMMSRAELAAARPLAKADFEDYIASIPPSRAALAELTAILGRLDGLESFSILKRRNRESEPDWGCGTLVFSGWVDVVDDGYADGLKEVNHGLMEQIVRLCNLPTLRRLAMNCRIPPFVWVCNPSLEHVKIKGILVEPAAYQTRSCSQGKSSGWDRFKLVDCNSERREKHRKMNMEIVEDETEGLVTMMHGTPGALERVRVARFDIQFRENGKHREVESWLYKFLELSAETLEQLSLSIAELPKISSPGAQHVRALPALRNLRISFRTDLRWPPVWKRVARLLEPILHSAQGLAELCLEIMEPGYHSWDPVHCGKTFGLIKELDLVLGRSIAEHAELKQLKVRVEHNCHRLEWCQERLAKAAWFEVAKENRKEVEMKLEQRAHPRM